MDASLDLQTLEQYCETLYNPPNPSSRAQAESLLNYHCPPFSSTYGSGTGHAETEGHSPNVHSPIDSALLCRRLLDSSKNLYALMFATSRLKSLVEDHFTNFAKAEQHGLRSFVLQYIYQHPDLPPFIFAAQAQMFAIITKLGWTENAEFRHLLDHIQVFFQHAADHRVLGIRVLEAVTVEMNIPGTRNIVKHRKSAIGFRDGQLLPIFQAALSMLSSVLQSGLSDGVSNRLKQSILLLMKACLSFDFIGTSYEESSDDLGCIQAPTTWRAVFEESDYLTVLWECWKSCSSPVSVVAMECLSQAASIRRSIFSSGEARNIYISHFMREIALTLSTAAGQTQLQDVGNFHEFCRMLSRFKSTFQIAEIGSDKESKQWFTAIGEFSEKGFHSWKWSPNSIPYLLTFWNKAVSSLSSAPQETELLIEAITVSLTKAYLKSRLECVHAVQDGEVDDPLEPEETLMVSLEAFANIARTKYTESGRLIVNEFQSLLLKYRELIQRASAFAGAISPPMGSTDVKESLLVLEMQLTWLVHIMAACIGARVMYQSTSEEDQMDGEFACEVLGFIQQLQVWTAQRPSYLASADAHLHVQSAIIHFYTQFRSTYIGEDSAKAVKVYTQLSARWALNTPNQMLDIILNSSLSNLRSSGNPEWRKQEDQLVLRTLRLFTNLASGSVKYIRKLDTTKALLRNHSSSEFRFLDPTWKSSDTAVRKCRTIYYTILSRILFAEDNIDSQFWRFVKPWEETLDRVSLAFEGSGSLGEEDIQLILLGIFKDLRGFVSSISNRRQFNLFYEWFYPTYTPLVLRAIEIWPQKELSIALLRFWQEYATNKCSRVTFESSSPNGILLFRETSNILYTYGGNLLKRPATNESTRWSEKYKGIMLYFNILSVSLSGKYANFGVFKLYGDKALERVLDIFFQLLLSISMSDMISFPKLAPAYFSLIDVFATDHMTGLPSMPPPVLAYILRSLGAAIPIQTLDATSCTMACSAIDKICTFVLNWLIKHKIRKADDGSEDEMSNSIQEDDDSSHVVSGLYASLGGFGSRASAGDLTGGVNHNRNSNSNVNSSSSLLSSSRRQDQYQDGSLHWLVEFVLSSKDLLSYLFAALFQVITFENRSNHWSLSRPLLGLILLNREFFLEYTRIFVQAQLPDRQEPLQKAIDGLMEGIEDNLTTVNRDRFTTNATAFRRECSQMTLMAISLDSTDTMA
ncbi:Exportin 7 [Mortierella alpina]|uniref:Exportin 7 n=1 Tax=Mortierella alpina TaxID=64518 RepID=A0A9P6JCY4_MORAP|nr:Exportin 7 [Mortierella alpina]